MGLAKEKPLYDPPMDYEDDFYIWLYQQIELLQQKRINEVDLPNLIEELEDMGREQLHALESSYRLVISHLLKWQFQPQMRSASWEVTIIRERANIEAREGRNPSLKSDAANIAFGVYRHALREAMVETHLARSTFPSECPWTVDQLRDIDFMPD